jgi:hypothetical protein
MRIAPQTSIATAQRAGKQARADVLPRNARKALHVPEDGRAEKREQRSPDGIVELHETASLRCAQDGFAARREVT